MIKQAQKGKKYEGGAPLRCGFHICCRPLFSSPVFTFPKTSPNLGCPSRNQKYFYTLEAHLCLYVNSLIFPSSISTLNQLPLNHLPSIPTISFPIYKNAYIRLQKFSGNQILKSRFS